MDASLSEICVDDLNLDVAKCVFAVWQHDGPKQDEVTAETVLETLQDFWPSQSDPLLLIARNPEEEVVGFRFGHALPDDHGRRVFWDENGGVHPNWRRRGIGRALLRMQHQIAAQRGYDDVRTAAALPLKPMIILNLQEGFDITGIGTFHGDGWTTRAVLFDKRLTAG